MYYNTNEVFNHGSKRRNYDSKEIPNTYWCEEYVKQTHVRVTTDSHTNLL